MPLLPLVKSPKEKVSGLGMASTGWPAAMRPRSGNSVSPRVAAATATVAPGRGAAARLLRPIGWIAVFGNGTGPGKATTSTDRL